MRTVAMQPSAHPLSGTMKYKKEYQMKINKILIVGTAVVSALLLSGCQEEEKIAYYRSHPDSQEAIVTLYLSKINAAPDDIKFTYTPEIRRANGKDTAPKMTFSKPGKVLLSIGAKVQNLCFVEEVWADKKNNKIRLTFTPYNFEGKNFDWRTNLLDLKGDADFRYLIIADYHTGTTEGDMKGYVIDVKDNFKHIATIPIGEAFDIPYTNPKLIFEGEK